MTSRKEPWRYKLECGHHNFLAVTPKGKSEKKYKCDNCRKYFSHKIDKKTGKKISANK